MTHGGREAGSVLVEALVAVAIVAAMSGLWFDSLGQNARQQRFAAESRLAMLVARSQIATVGVLHAVAPGEQAGHDGGFAWRIATEPQPDAGPGIYAVTVEVAGVDGRRRVVLRSLRVGQ